MITTTWEDLEREALNSPALYQAVMAVRRGAASREEAAIVVAVHLAVALRDTQKAFADYLATAPQRPILIDKEAYESSVNDEPFKC